MISLPRCSARITLQNELDCDAKHDKDCEKCLCSYYATGGTVHPESGIRYPGWLCWLLYGKSGADQ